MKTKKLLLAAVAVIALAANTMAQVPNYLPTNGLVGWWPFNGNANDESGNGNNGTVNGATLTSDRFGSTNMAYSFNGVNTNINLGSIANSGNFSVSAYFMISVKKFYNTIVCKGDGGPACKNFEFRLDTNALSSFIGNNSTWLDAVSYQNLMINNWYHTVLTYDGSQLKMYFQGNLVQSQNYTGYSYDFQNLYVGSRTINSQGNLNFVFNGKIDDIGIWNRALTQQEITTLYQGCTNPPAANITPQGNTTFCQGGFVTLAASTATGNTYQWYVNNSAIGGATNANYTATQSGNYTVVVVYGGCSATSSPIAVNVNTSPTVSLNLISPFININAAPILLSGSPSGGIFTGTGVSSNSFNPNNAGLGTHSIAYNYTNSNGCTGSAYINTVVYDTLGNVCTSYDTVLVSVTDTLIINTSVTGINPPNNINLIKLFPNPAHSHITIDYGNYLMMIGYTLKITNTTGQQMFQTTINQQTSYISLASWTGNGLYFVHIIDPQGNTVDIRKIVLQ